MKHFTLCMLAAALSCAFAPAAAPEEPAGPPGGIAWFATWKSGLREAERSGRPILLIAGAPSCSGVPGVW